MPCSILNPQRTNNVNTKYFLAAIALSQFAGCGLVPTKVVALNGEVVQPATSIVVLAGYSTQVFPNEIEQAWGATIVQVDDTPIEARSTDIQIKPGQHNITYDCWAKASHNDMGGVKGRVTLNYTFVDGNIGQKYWSVVQPHYTYRKNLSPPYFETSGTCSVSRLSNQPTTLAY
jgi:hypothetical protein